MTLLDFKNYISEFPKETIFNYGISEPFSWRGSYSEVAFQFLEESMSAEKILQNINLAYEGTFYGYKGGDYTYYDYTEVNFESNYGSWTDGGYVSAKIAEIEKTESYSSQEDRLVKLAFSSK